jgi:hypothetical protein
MDARRRAVPALLGLVGFTVLGRALSPEFWSHWWFFVGLGTAMSVTFAEPFFSRAQDGILNGVGAVAAFLAADRSNANALWVAYLFLGVVVLGAAFIAVLTRPDSTSRLKWAANRIASHLGRAVLLGFIALFIEVIGRANARTEGWEMLALGVAVLIGSLTVDWWQVLNVVRRPPEVHGVALAAFGPHLLLARAPDTSLAIGCTVRVQGTAGQAFGRVVSRMSHSDGLRYEIALTEEWTSVARVFPDEISIQSETSKVRPFAGVANAGSTDTSVTFQPLAPLAIGDPIWLQERADELLYQVTGLRLARSGWAGASALVPQAEARQVGSITTDGRLLLRPRLPTPHEALYLEGTAVSALPPFHIRLGHIRGTDIPIGMAVDNARRGHLAILGMSGMGKTAVAHRLAMALGAHCLVVAVDTTGEYISRLGFPRWDSSDIKPLGHFAHEPSGETTLQCRRVVEQLMTVASTEYSSGAKPAARVILLEEAHTFIPEWNFAGKHQQDHVNYTTRLIMQARKFGLTFVIVSQRTAVVSKSGLSQCENYVVLRTIDDTSLSYMESVVGSTVRDTISSLRRFEALCIGPSFNSDGPVVIELDPPP